MRTRVIWSVFVTRAVDKPVRVATYPRINATAPNRARPCDLRISATGFTHKRYRPCSAKPVVVRVSAMLPVATYIYFL